MDKFKHPLEFFIWTTKSACALVQKLKRKRFSNLKASNFTILIPKCKDPGQSNIATIEKAISSIKTILQHKLPLQETMLIVCVCVCVCIYIYIYIYMKKEIERDVLTSIFCCSRWAARSSSWVWAVMIDDDSLKL